MAALLYVDDNPGRLRALTARLAVAGYKVLAAKDGVEALEIFRNKRIDLVVVDYYMNGMGGDAVAVEMKRLHPDIPIVIFSGTFTLPEFVIALVDGFVFTGDELDSLTDKIKELLEKQAATKTKRASESSLGAA